MTARSEHQWGDTVGDLYRQHFGELVLLARRLVDTVHAAEEVVQEGFVRFAALDTPPTEGRELPYLRSIVMNEARSQLRHRRVRDHYRATRRPARPIPMPDDICVGREDAAALGRNLEALPARQREVLVLRFIGELSEREIATTLGITPGSVKTHAHRGIRSLRSTLAPAS